MIHDERAPINLDYLGVTEPEDDEQPLEDQIQVNGDGSVRLRRPRTKQRGQDDVEYL